MALETPSNVHSKTFRAGNMPILLAALVLVLDQGSKVYIRANYWGGEFTQVIDGFFRITHVKNPGAAWGMLGDHTEILTGVSVVMMLLMIAFRKSIFTYGLSQRIAYGLLLGGILGNLIDRVKYGEVTDFLLFYIGQHEWPTFNIADSAICIGVGLYMIGSFRLQPAESPPPPIENSV